MPVLLLAFTVTVLFLGAELEIITLPPWFTETPETAGSISQMKGALSSISKPYWS